MTNFLVTIKHVGMCMANNYITSQHHPTTHILLGYLTDTQMVSAKLHALLSNLCLYLSMYLESSVKYIPHPQSELIYFGIVRGRLPRPRS